MPPVAVQALMVKEGGVAAPVVGQLLLEVGNEMNCWRCPGQFLLDVGMR